jgi:hypothetical protein
MGIFVTAKPVNYPGAPAPNPDGSMPGGVPGSGLAFPSTANSPEVRNPGPRTFSGQNVTDRTNPGVLPGLNQTFTDGSGSRYVNAIAGKGYFEYKTASPIYILVNSLLSMWTTRTWTHNIQTAQGYLSALISFLGLDWVGRAFGRGSTIPGLGSTRSASKFEKFGESGAREPGHE